MPWTWRGAPWGPDLEARAQALAGELHLPLLAGRVLAARNFTARGAARWLDLREEDFWIDPFRIPDMEKACTLVEAVLRAGGTVAVVGDYDVDGITGAALLAEALEAVGGRVRVILPRREEGYGLQPRHVDEALRQGADLVLAVDSGTHAHEGVARAKALGLPVVVLDHHQVGENPAPADALVNPHRPDAAYPFPHLAGVGVALKFLQALLGRGKDAPWRSSLDLVALGTVADGMPLVGENRLWVREGMELLRTAMRPGLKLLWEEAGRPYLTAHTAAFSLVPRLNAPGRLGDPRPSLELLLSLDEEGAEGPLAAVIQAQRERQKVEGAVLAHARLLAREKEEDPVLFLYDPHWHPGVLGLVAGKLARDYGRPVLLAGKMGGWVRGSGRAAGGADLLQLLSPLKPLFHRLGGHREAVGFTLAEEKVEEVARGIQAQARSRVWAGPEPVRVDAPADLRDVDEAFLAFLESFGPYGPGHEEPLFLFPDVTLRAVRPMGKDGRHLRLSLGDGRGSHLPAVGFSLSGRFPLGDPPGRWALVGRVEKHHFNGDVTVRLRVEDGHPQREERRYRAEVPGRALLAQLYRILKALGDRTPLLPGDPSRMAVACRKAGLPLDLSLEDLAQGLKVFSELGVLAPLKKGTEEVFLWVPPQGKLELWRSPTYRRHFLGQEGGGHEVPGA
ncbi:MAG: single-stranded-DNA-specific exonuclease RecJ [Clostridiales bacterium]|nr:single-stranded-DNA-specific exonuclease RecJ [Clostridiales bacterium]